MILSDIMRRYREEDRGHATPCWIWAGYTNAKGYGYVHSEQGLRQTHRLFYEQLIGPIPEGKQIDHLCMVKSCCNPTHLEPVSPKENVRRAIAAGLSPVSKLIARTHCERGHAYTSENTYFWAKKPNARMCRECCRENQRRQGDVARRARSAPPREKITPQQALDIRGDTRSCTVIGREYGIHKATVCKIRAGKLWKDAA